MKIEVEDIFPEGLVVALVYVAERLVGMVAGSIRGLVAETAGCDEFIRLGILAVGNQDETPFRFLGGFGVFRILGVLGSVTGTGSGMVKPELQAAMVASIKKKA